MLTPNAPVRLTAMQHTIDIKQAAHQLIDQLPKDATWDDVLYRLVERREIELGLADSEAGRTTEVEDAMKEFGITPFMFKPALLMQPAESTISIALSISANK